MGSANIHRYLLDNFEKVLANFCLASLVVILGMQVFFRYILQIGLSWSEELSRFSFIWFVYISASLAVQKGRHIRVTAGVDLLPAFWRPWADWIAVSLWLFLNAAIVFSGFWLVGLMLAHPMYSASLYLSMAYLYLIIPVAHVFMIWRIFQRILQRDKDGRRNFFGP